MGIAWDILQQREKPRANGAFRILPFSSFPHSCESFPLRMEGQESPKQKPQEIPEQVRNEVVEGLFHQHHFAGGAIVPGFQTIEVNA